MPFPHPRLLLAALLTFAASACAISAPPTVERVAGQQTFVLSGQITDLSGLCWAGGDLFYAVSDKRPALLPVTLKIDRATGAITSGEFAAPIPVPAAERDFEGVAYVAGDHRFYVATETPAAVLSFRPGDREVRSLPLPPPLTRTRHGLSIESLTWNETQRHFWIANEESLISDGPVTSASAGTVVRLAKLDAEFKQVAQYAWRTEPATMRFGAGCGVADLLLLPDGTLIVLERGFAGLGLAVRLFAADFEGATDIANLPALEDATFTPARKTKLFVEGSGVLNFEGLTLGPELADGSRSLILVADSHGGTEHHFLPMKIRMGK